MHIVKIQLAKGTFVLCGISKGVNKTAVQCIHHYRNTLPPQLMHKAELEVRTTVSVFNAHP